MTPQRFAQELGVMESMASKAATRIIKGFHGFYEYPRKDAAGQLRHGWGRPIERRAQPRTVADFAISTDMNRARQVLHFRVATLMVKSPVPEHKLATLYAIADIIEAEKLRDWGPLWEAMEQGAWSKVVRELLRCDMDRLLGGTDRSKDMFADLVMNLVSDQPPEGYSR